MTRLIVLVLAAGLVAGAPARAAEPAAPAHETNCSDGKDDDGDTVTDCADADCYTTDACKAGGPENTDQRCSDWVDNDGDGQTDCDDDDCNVASIRACKGSWREQTDAAKDDEPTMKDLAEGEDVSSFIGTRGDLDGERSNDTCADGLDNDGDGRTDCADFGCRYDPSVTVCQQTGGIRFSVVAGVQATTNLVTTSLTDVNFSRIQMRALGSIPGIQNSFFLLSMRAERSTRLTFAMFQVPLGGGHYVNLNSGGGGLSSSLITSTANQLLIDSPFYVYNAFEQGNGAAVEAGGPLVGNKLRYRAFLGGGSGVFNGNVGGRYFKNDNTNFTWSAGGQVQFNAIGSFSRLDSPYLYTPAPTSLGFLAGVKYDQRATERYPAINLYGLYRSGRFLVQLENYTKQELEWGSTQTAYVVQAAFLAIPKKLLIACDFGQYLPGAFDRTPPSTTLAAPLGEWQGRIAAHYYVWRNIGIVSAMFDEHHTASKIAGGDDTLVRELTVQFQFRY